MYKQFKRGLDSVDDALQKSLSNLSVADLKRPSGLGDVTEESERTDTPSELSDDDDQHDSHITEIVQECWSQIGAQCVQYGHQARYKRVPDDGAWKTVRVFVSSTFTDFFCEREVLVKKVFPALREWCRKRKLYLVDCDLRWGIPKDTTTADTISTCLEELDRCLQETGGEPFFLNMLGEKYGWCPGVDDIPEVVKRKFDWVANTSITFMEILHGAYRMQNSNALFMMRKESIMSSVPDRLLSRFKSTEPLDIEHLQHLKTGLQSRFSDQLFEYDCKVEGTIEKHGKEIVNIVDLELFCEQVEEFFKTAIQRMYPNRDVVQPGQSRVLVQNEEQEMLMEELSSAMVGRQQEADAVMAYLLEGKTQHLSDGTVGNPFSRDAEYWRDLMSCENQLLCVHGQPGHGKTTLLAWLTQKAIQNGGCRVFYHFCGGTGESQQLDLLLQRLVAFFTQDYSLDHLETLYQRSPDELKDIIKEKLVAMTTSGDERIVLVIDGLDVLQSSNSVNHLSWLAPSFPACVRCIVSCGNHPPSLSRIQEHAHYSITLDALLREDAKKIVQLFLERFSKKLETSQLQMILDSTCSTSPLWLYFICEELRIYGDFRTLSTHVQTVTTSMEAVLEYIMRRLISEDDTGCMETTLCLIACCYGVITALDLQRMLGNVGSREPLAPLYWARVRTSLQAYLRVTNYNDQITFVHDKVKQVIYNTVLKASGRELECHTLLSDYLEHWCEDVHLKTECLPNHMATAKLKERLVNYLRTAPETSRIPSFRRSAYISNYRCRNLADPVIKGVGKVIICQFCKMSRAVYHPMKSHCNQNMCVVCGNMIVGVHSSNGHVCQFHNAASPQNWSKCFLCNKITMPEQGIVGRLCMHCGFGHGGKRCIVLDLR